MNKTAKLREIISSYGKVAIAYSGGIDSALLAAVASEILGKKLLLIHIAMPMVPERESSVAKSWAHKQKIKLSILNLNPLSLPEIRRNGADRCYQCKLYIMRAIQKEASLSGIDIVADGTNSDDCRDFRPGLKALNELGIDSPLADAGFTKDEVRELARSYGLENWNTPPTACLATRIPQDIALDGAVLKRVALAEEFLFSIGFELVRVRVLGNMAKIEIQVCDFERFITERDNIVSFMQTHGFSEVTLDLQGYRQGSMNTSQRLHNSNE